MKEPLEKKVQVPIWIKSPDGSLASSSMEVTKRCIVTERKYSVAASKKIFEKTGQVPTSKKYTIDNCPVYELEKCVIPNDIALKSSDGRLVEMCAQVRVNTKPSLIEIDQRIAREIPEDVRISRFTTEEDWNEWRKERAGRPEILNRIAIRPTGCKIFIGEHEESIPFGHPHGLVACVHTPLLSLGAEQAAEMPEEVLLDTIKQGPQPISPELKKPFENPEFHFGALWSYVQGLAEVGLQNMFEAAAGANASIGFNSAMQGQIFKALLTVAKKWTTYNLIPLLLDAWEKTLPKWRNEIFQELDDQFDLMDIACQNPDTLRRITQLFPNWATTLEYHCSKMGNPDLYPVLVNSKDKSVLAQIAQHATSEEVLLKLVNVPEFMVRDTIASRKDLLSLAGGKIVKLLVDQEHSIRAELAKNSSLYYPMNPMEEKLAKEIVARLQADPDPVVRSLVPKLPFMKRNVIV